MTPAERKYLPAGRAAAWIAFVLLLATYWLTVAPTVSYWDCPEYVAAAYRLEVGHPPGNPFWMLVERVVTMLAPSTAYVALAVNLSSGLFTALAGFFLALTVFRVALFVLLKLPRRRLPAPLAAAGTALTAALAFGWCDSVWFSSVEAEVYAMSVCMTSLCLWLMTVWAGTRSRPDSWRLLILIAYIFGLSIGVHQLNLLCIPVLALIWGVRRNVRSPWKLLYIFVISLGAVGCVLAGVMPSTIALAAQFELFFVNTLRMPMLTGVGVYVAVLGISLLVAVASTRRNHPRLLMALACWPALFLSGAFIFAEHFLAGAVISAAVALFLVSHSNFEARRLSLAMWMLAFLLTGYSCYALIPIRGSVPSPANAAMPGDPFSFAAYQSREQYGSKPLLYGRTPYSKPLLAEDTGTSGEPIYRRYAVERTGDIYVPKIAGAVIPDDPASISPADSARNARILSGPGDGYVKRGMKLKMRTTPELDMFFPRITSSDPFDLSAYNQWIGMDSSTMTVVEISEAVDSAGNAVGKLNADGSRRHVTSLRPTYLQHLQWLAAYQTGYMYWRYVLWNFSGRQNDRASQGEVQHGNFITGIPTVDNAMLGAEESLPPIAGKENPGRNRFFMLPLLLGIIGMAWLMKSRRRGMQVCGINAVLFIMTGLAITVYLNQDPGEPRERDYSFLGSFLAYAVWIGFGGLAVARRLRSLWAFAIPLAITAWMGYENWDDHDRSGRTAARNVTLNILNSLEPDAVIFVNGDNATFPLWYAQEVEGVRTDVRVVNTAYLKSPVYAANLLGDWRYSKALPSVLSKEEIIWGAYRSPVIGNSPDTLSATEAYRALRRSKGKSFPGRYVKLRISADSTVVYDLRNLRGKSGRVDFGNLMMFGFIAATAESASPRPAYWVYSLGSGKQAGLEAWSTDMLFARRFGLIDTDRAVKQDAHAAENLLAPNKRGRKVYMDHVPASQIARQRGELTAAGFRALRAGYTREALDMARKADTLMGADPGSYGTVLISDTAFNTRRLLAALLSDCADTLDSKSGRKSAESQRLKFRAGVLSAQADTLAAQWHRYRMALPPRLRSKMAPVY